MTASTTPGPRILVVDDNDDNRYTLTLYLELEGYADIQVAEDGEQAIGRPSSGPSSRKGYSPDGTTVVTAALLRAGRPSPPVHRPSAAPLPTPEALLEFSSRRHLPSTTDAIRAAETECFQQVHLAVAHPKLIS